MEEQESIILRNGESNGSAMGKPMTTEQQYEIEASLDAGARVREMRHRAIRGWATRRKEERNRKMYAWRIAVRHAEPKSMQRNEDY